MIKLSVNINKVATLRNSRGGQPRRRCWTRARVCVDAGAPGVTVHPRADARHITERDVREVCGARCGDLGGRTEFNIEGDPRPDLLALVHELRPTQCTLVPVRPGEITSQAGWPADTPRDASPPSSASCARPASASACSSIPKTAPVRWAADVGADRVELYTEPFARAFERGPGRPRELVSPLYAPPRSSRMRWASASTPAMTSTSRIWCSSGRCHTWRKCPSATRSISHALFVGLDRSVREYLSVLRTT